MFFIINLITVAKCLNIYFSFIYFYVENLDIYLNVLEINTRIYSLNYILFYGKFEWKGEGISIRKVAFE